MLYQKYFLRMNQRNMNYVLTLLLFFCLTLIAVTVSSHGFNLTTFADNSSTNSSHYEFAGRLNPVSKFDDVMLYIIVLFSISIVYSGFIIVIGIDIAL